MRKGSHHSEESIKKMSRAHKGHPGNKGFKFSKESRERLSKSKTGSTMSIETKFKKRNKMKKPIKFSKNENGCYICISHSYRRYPKITYLGKSINMSRYIWELRYGKIPDGIHICHTCDNPACINIKHFFLGAPIDNIKDCVSKGRHNYGEKIGNHKLSEKDIKEIRSIASYRGISVDLSKKYGVTPENIMSIRNKKTWKHIP